MDMDDIDDIIREELERYNCNSTATSCRLQPSSLPSRQPSPETALPPDSARDTVHRPSCFSSQVGPNAPIALVVPVTTIAPAACAGAGTIPYPSTKPYQVMVEKPVSRKSEVVTPVASTSSEVVTPVASTSRACTGASSLPPGSTGPYAVIVEQPEQRKRFRYDSEIGSAGAIHGVNFTKDNKSYPRIEIRNYTGPAVITVSLVCKNKPYRVHPNGIVGKKKVSNDDFTFIYVKKVLVTRQSFSIEFCDVGIRFVKPNQIEEALHLREVQGIDPFKQGYIFSPERDDLQAVRLCFQVSLVTQQLRPVISDVIYHTKKLSCLNIRRMCECRGNKSGGPDIIFLSKELHKRDLEVVFYEEEEGLVVWEACGRIVEVYGRSAIECAAPAYTRAGVQRETEVTVSVALRRLSDGERGDPRSFTYASDDAEVYMKKRKTRSDEIQQYVEKNWTPPASLPPEDVSQYDQDWNKLPRPFDLLNNMPERSFGNLAILGSNSVNPTMPGPFNFNSVIPGSNSTNPAVSGPNHDTLAEPGLSSINPFLPGPSQFELMQTNIPLSPDMDPMSVSEDEGVLSPNWHLDSDGGIPSVDTALADACANVLDF